MRTDNAGSNAITLSAGQRRIVVLVALVASAVVVVWAFSGRLDSLDRLRDLDLDTVLRLMGLQAAYVLVQSGRLHTIITAISHRRVEVLAWVRIHVVARFLNILLPQVGNLYRAVEVKNQFGIPLTSYVATLASAAWLGMIFNLTLAALLLAWAAPDFRVAGVSILVPIIGGTAALVVLPFLASVVLRRLVTPNRILRWLLSRMTAVAEMTTQSVRSATYLVRLLLWSTLGFALAVVLLWITLRGLGLTASLADVAVFMVILQFTSYVTVTPGNLGVQEALFGLAGSLVSLGAAEGVLASLVLRITGWLTIAIIAIPLGGIDALRRARSSFESDEP